MKNSIALSQNEVISMFGVYGAINAELGMTIVTPAKTDHRCKNNVRVLKDPKKLQLLLGKAASFKKVPVFCGDFLF